MTRPTRTHYARRNESGLVFALCGLLSPNATREKRDVTCRMCIKRLADVPFAPEEVVPDAKPWTPPAPKTGPFAGTRSRPGHDGYAKTFRVARWATVEQALTVVAVARVDGYSRKSTASLTDHLVTDGVRVDGGQPGTPKALREADDVADVGRCLEAAFAPDAWDGELNADQARDVVMARLVGVPTLDRIAWAGQGRVQAQRAWKPADGEELAERFGVSLGVISGCIKKARRRLLIDLCARGLVAVPTAPSSHRLRAAIEDRENELTRRVA